MKTAPVLFIGSGFSRRYCGAPSWRELLDELASLIHPELPHPFLRYRNIEHEMEADDPLLLPKIAKHIETDFNHWYFNDVDFIDSLPYKLNDNLIKQQDISPFRLYLAEKFSKISLGKLTEELKEELSDLTLAARHSINAIITTNYDCFLEQRFPSFTSFRGQADLVSSKVTGFQEIYKIHGCCKDPESIIFTEDDYASFQEKKAYVAAKILTLFVEQPIIFLGYSVSDPNIQNILEAIAGCLNQRELESFGKHLFYIDYNAHIEQPQIGPMTMKMGNKSLTLNRISVSSFVPVFKNLARVRRNYDISILRKVKADLYQTVTSNKPQDTIAVVSDECDFAYDSVGRIIGFTNVEGESQSHYYVEPFPIYENVLSNKHKFDIKSLLISNLAKQVRQKKEFPLFFYVRKYIESGYPADSLPEYALEYMNSKHVLEDFFSESIRKQRLRNKVAKFSDCFIPYKEGTNISLENICSNILQLPEEALLSNETFEYIKSVFCADNFKTNMRRLVRIFDWYQNRSTVQRFLEGRC